MEAMITTFGEAFETAARPSTDYLERLLGSKHFIGLAALKDDTIVGGLTVDDSGKATKPVTAPHLTLADVKGRS
jgi:hypothetical protein